LDASREAGVCDRDRWRGGGQTERAIVRESVHARKIESAFVCVCISVCGCVFVYVCVYVCG